MKFPKWRIGFSRRFAAFTPQISTVASRVNNDYTVTLRVIHRNRYDVTR